MPSSNILYLHHQHLATAGMEATAGTALVEYLQRGADHFIQGHMVRDDEECRSAHQRFLDDVVTWSELKEANINVIYCEGGILSSFGERNGKLIWKVTKTHIEQFLADGGVFIAADVDWNFANRHSDDDFRELFAADFLYGNPERKEGFRSPVYLVDLARSQDPSWRRIKVDVPEMSKQIAEWLRPVYANVEGLVVQSPLHLIGSQTVLAFVGGPTCGSLCNDMWWSVPAEGIDPWRLMYHENAPMDRLYFGPFATVRQVGRGFAVLITGIISADDVARNCQGNAVWIENLAQHLCTCSARVVESVGFQAFRGVCVFLSHRSTNKPVVEAIGRSLRRLGVRIWLDRERILPSDSIGLSINGGLLHSSHLALFWSKDCIGAPWIDRELGAAVTLCVQEKKPLFVITLDSTPVPAIIGDLLRISVVDTPPEKVAKEIADAIVSLKKRSSGMP
jgi:hypothetical protein